MASIPAWSTMGSFAPGSRNPGQSMPEFPVAKDTCIMTQAHPRTIVGFRIDKSPGSAL